MKKNNLQRQFIVLSSLMVLIFCTLSFTGCSGSPETGESAASESKSEKFYNVSVQKFKVRYVADQMEKNPKEDLLGTITDVNDLLRKVEEYFIKNFGETVTHQKPYLVYYDSDCDVWYVCGTHIYMETFQTDTVQSVANIVVRNEDGRVLASWCE